MNKKGSAIYFALIVLTIILGIILGLSHILISQIKMVRGMEYSTVAFYAADSGVEEALILLQQYFQNDLPYYGDPSNPKVINLNGKEATYYITIKGGSRAPGGPHDGCDKEYYCIISEGEYQGIKRAIEVGN
ncbi:MAG: pilus assembly PilX N-terminal domain-containing protein [Minisyncoccales bacterium]|jgi:uncharacterized protein (UPF0333 family)